MMLRKYVSGFDYLRAIFSILVVIWHNKNLPDILEIDSDLYQNITKFFYYNICCLSVPIFFQISLFLFYKKQSVDANYFFKKKLPDLLVVYTIWISIGLTVNSLVSKGKSLTELGSIKGLVITLVAGSRPELYFLFSLGLLTFLAFLNQKFLLGRKNSLYLQLLLLILSLLAIVGLDLLAVNTHKHIFSVPWNPICFIPYIFSSSILVELEIQSLSNCAISFYENRLAIISMLLSIFLLISSQEWQLLNLPDIINNGELLPMYARISLVVGTLIISYCAILYTGQPPSLVKEISQASLGIYVMHRYILQFIEYLTQSQGIIFNPLIEIGFAVTIPILIGKLLKKHPMGRVMLNANYKHTSAPVNMGKI
jgi:surface polysaccharide O-acyltransferase-like enzyme